MSFRKRLLVFLGIVLLASALLALFAPFLVANGIRVWIGWAARSEGVSVELEKIEAPFLGEVTIHSLRVTPAKTESRGLSLGAAKVVLDLNFRGWFFSKRARLLGSLATEHVTGSIRRASATTAEKLDWRKIEQLLPDKIRIDDLDLDVVTETTSVTFRGVVLSASEIESGKFFARQIFVTSPILRQTFTDLRGATSWENSRLTIAGISLAHGLDLEALTIDVSRLTKRRLGVDLHLDTFGGTLRASFQGRGGEKFAIDLAGSASNISLAQISGAIGFLEPITGEVHASKFTFRGNPGEFFDATASVWIELADFAWRARRADNVMLGATYYNRRLEVDQLFLRQGQNELTVNGELFWPKKPVGWAQLQFQGQMNASVPDLNGFAQLFGATTGDFAGTLSAAGELDSLSPETHGRLTLRGQGVSFRGVGFDSLGASLQLRGSEVTLESLEVRHGNDFLRAQGTANLNPTHRYSARLTGALNDLAAYGPLLPASWAAAKIGGGLTFDWTGDGTVTTHSGTMQLFARGLQLPVAPLRSPLDLTLEGTYSPQDIFFRTFRLDNERVSLGGFLMLGSNFIELQALEVTLDGTPRIDGTLFLPFGVDRFRKTDSLFEAFDEQQKFDVDLTIDHLDLAQLESGLGENPTVTGVLDGKLVAYGPAQALQVTTNWHLENLGPATSPNSIDFGLRYAEGRAEVDGKAVFGVSDPVVLRASLPSRLEKRRLVDRTVIDPTKPLSFALDFPALFADKLPNMLRPLGASGGLVSGGIAFANTLRDPQISGEAQLSNLQITPAPPWPALTNIEARIHFGNRAAEIAPLRFELNDVPLAFRGSLTTSSTSFSCALLPVENEIGLAALPGSGEDISTVRAIGQGTAGSGPRLGQVFVRGTIGSPVLSLTIDSDDGVRDEALSSQTTLFLRPRAMASSPLLLDVAVPDRFSAVFELRPSPP